MDRLRYEEAVDVGKKSFGDSVIDHLRDATVGGAFDLCVDRAIPLLDAREVMEQKINSRKFAFREKPYGSSQVRAQSFFGVAGLIKCCEGLNGRPLDPMVENQREDVVAIFEVTNDERFAVTAVIGDRLKRRLSVSEMEKAVSRALDDFDFGFFALAAHL